MNGLEPVSQPGWCLHGGHHHTHHEGHASAAASANTSQPSTSGMARPDPGAGPTSGVTGSTERSAGLHLHVDPFSGIAGDMWLGAAVDLGVDADTVAEALREAGLSQQFRITIRRVQRHGIGACDLQVEASSDPGPSRTSADPAAGVINQQPDGKHDEHGHGHGHDHHHHHHHHPEHGTRQKILEIGRKLPLSPRGRQRVEAAVNALAEAEARVHGTTPDQVHFHEVGALDSIVDLLGSVYALELLGVDSVSCGPLPLSSGFVRCAHGLMPVPAPATAYLMEGMPTIGVQRRGELVTPTGAALLRGVVDHWGAPPAMTLTGTGYGAGDREDPDVPNLLRLMLGRR